MQIKILFWQFVCVFECVQLIRQQCNWWLFLVCTDQSKWSNWMRTHCKRIAVRQFIVSVDVCKLILRNRVCSYVKHCISVSPLMTWGEFSVESDGKSLWCGAFIVGKYLNVFLLLFHSRQINEEKKTFDSNRRKIDRTRFITIVFWSCNNGNTFLQPNLNESIHLSQLLYDVVLLSDWLRKRYLYNNSEFYTTCWARFTTTTTIHVYFAEIWIRFATICCL